VQRRDARYAVLNCDAYDHLAPPAPQPVAWRWLDCSHQAPVTAEAIRYSTSGLRCIAMGRMQETTDHAHPVVMVFAEPCLPHAERRVNRAAKRGKIDCCLEVTANSGPGAWGFRHYFLRRNKLSRGFDHCCLTLLFERPTERMVAGCNYTQPQTLESAISTPMNMPDSVRKHMLVTMQYTLATADGVVIREAKGRPIRYIQGCGTLFAKLEAALEGHRVGDLVRVRLLPDDAFGKRNLDLVHEAPMEELPPGEHIEIGGQIVGTSDRGEQVTFRITDVTNNIVRLDGNHPLAGQTLIFEVEIQGLEQASEEQIHAGKINDN
jgi:FKBP-type peptidyl-prolyl cis-trans isomerase SlyD